MRPAAIYSCPTAAREPRKEALVDAHLYTSLAALAEVERRMPPDIGRPRRDTGMPTGLARVRHRESIIALGCAAMTALADVEKVSAITGDLELEGEFPVVAVEDIESLVWSCANTTKIIALGRAAWRSIQMLPVDDRRFSLMPPLKMPATVNAKLDNVLVVDHGASGEAVRDLIGILCQERMDVVCVDRNAPAARRDAVWDDRSAIHVHVGDHTLDAEEPRLVDSWVSDRLAIQLETERVVRSARHTDTLRIESEVNGFICASPQGVVATCRELSQDAVLRRKLIAAGRSTVAPLVATWSKIAGDMLA